MCGCFAYVYACVPHACNARGCQKWALEPLGLELQMVVSHHVGSGNQAPGPGVVSHHEGAENKT